MGFHFITIIIIITEKNKTIDANLSFGAANYEDFGATDIGTDCFSRFWFEIFGFFSYSSPTLKITQYIINFNTFLIILFEFNSLQMNNIIKKTFTIFLF